VHAFSKWPRQPLGAVILLGAGVASLAAPVQSSSAAAWVAPPKTWVRSVTSYAPPGVGAHWRTSLKNHSQVVVADGINNGTRTVKMTLWTYIGGNQWRNDGAYAAVGGSAGWNKTRQGDHRSPTGVFALTDAGGYYRNPGTKLPYQYSPSSYSTILNGVRVFSYAVSINYNHVAGTAPSSTRTPMGSLRGSQIWMHETHGSTSRGCIGTSRAGMVKVLRWLNPRSKPVIVMGPHSSIIRTR